MNFNKFGIDAYCLTANTNVAPFDPTNTVNFAYLLTDNRLWPGSYSSNMFYDPQDLFDTNKTSEAFTNRMGLASSRTNSEDRYTFERLLSNIGMGSAPEYGTWVYDDLGNSTLRTKVNINFDNTTQIQNGPYSPMPTNLVNWTPLGFFTNAAELLLRSQTFTFIYTNYVTLNGVSTPNGTYVTNLYFGVTNIPVFRVYNPSIQYNEAIHRMLQLAANIYSDTVNSNFTAAAPIGRLAVYGGQVPPVRHPFVFRPIFQVVGVGTSNWGVNIVGFTNIVGGESAYLQMQQPYVDLTSNNVVRGTINDYFKRGSAFNISGVPWVVSAEKGLPQFYQYSYNNRILFTRKVLFSRYGQMEAASRTPTRPPQFTNQFYVMSVSNSFGIGAWNPYTIPFTGSAATGGTTYYISNYVTVELTNNYHYGYTNNFSYISYPGGTFQWPPWSGVPNQRNTSGFVTLFTNNTTGIPSCYFSEARNQLIFFTNNIISSNSFLPFDTNQTSWPVHNWTLNITNHVVYALFDGSPTSGSGGALLDFVNLGPFGSSISITNQIMNGNNGGLPGAGDFAGNFWAITPATDLPGSRMSQGLLNQIVNAYDSDATIRNSLAGTPGSPPNIAGGWTFGLGNNPSNVVDQSETWVANDPLVHYTIGDLTWPVFGDSTLQGSLAELILPMTNSVGVISKRFDPWPGQGYSGTTGANMLFKDPMVTNAMAWKFPTNKFPSIGWLGRVHRGTPWQTVYFKSDNPNNTAVSAWVSDWVNTFDTYPTNDWNLADLFTTALNDNAERGLLSVNQTNDAAWAAVLSGVIALTNVNGGVAIAPTNVYQFVEGTNYPFASVNGINYVRSTNVNGLFHKVGQILSVPALTVQSPFLANTPASEISDEAVERIPQQIMGLLKVGEPQFVIYSWGESLRPKNLYLSSPNNNLCTNYEITGEFLGRTVCHVVHTNGFPKMVIDSYNIEPAN